MPIALMSIARMVSGKYQLPRTAKSASTTTRPTAFFGVRPSSMSPSLSVARTASPPSSAAVESLDRPVSDTFEPSSQRGPISRADSEYAMREEA